MPRTCKHPTCQDECRREKKEKSVKPLKRSPLKKTAVKKEPKEKRVKLTPLPKLKEQAQKVCNLYIRLRDQHKACISCGSDKADQAGHYIAVNQCSFLRYDERNIHLQCAGCNCYKHGNSVAYRIELRKRIGEFELERLERDFIENRTHKWSRAELEAIKAYYQQKIKELSH